jgi:hypothetical protein
MVKVLSPELAVLNSFGCMAFELLTGRAPLGDIIATPTGYRVTKSSRARQSRATAH